MIPASRGSAANHGSPALRVWTARAALSLPSPSRASPGGEDRKRYLPSTVKASSTLLGPAVPL
jgi:hypothetical protein